MRDDFDCEIVHEMLDAYRRLENMSPKDKERNTSDEIIILQHDIRMIREDIQKLEERILKLEKHQTTFPYWYWNITPTDIPYIPYNITVTTTTSPNPEVIEKIDKDEAEEE